MAVAEIENARISSSSSTDPDGSSKDHDSQGVPVLENYVTQANVEHNLRHDFVDHRLNDPNMETEKIDAVEAALEKGDYKAEVKLEEELEEDSPYPEVRAAVSNVDDPTMPVMTFRAWTIGLFFAIVIPGVNQLLSYRYPTVTIGALVAQLLSYPIGCFMAAILPERVFKTRFGSFTLNPGPFNVKEHTIITIMSNVTYQRAYATNVAAAQRVIYHFDWGFGWILLLTISSQMIGFSMAGFCRRWLVWPASMIWPANLGTTALMSALHNQINTGEGHMTRFRMFLWVFLGSFVWYFFPGFIFLMLSVGNWFCLIAPKNVVLNQMLGTQQGLGLIPLTLDWTQVTYNGNPLYTPWWSQANVFGGFIIMYVFLGPILYYNNVWNTAYLPYAASGTYDRFGNSYQVANVTTADHKFDPEAYNAYSEEYFTITYAISFGLSFAAITGVIVHTALFHGQEIVRQFKTSLNEERDIHARLMQRYPEVPKLWYGILFVICFGLGIACVAGWDTGLPVWAFILAIIIGAFFMLPVGVVTAVSNQEVGLNVISELIIGYMCPGSPTGMMMFKVFCYMSVYQGLSFISDMKVGHYMKVPPKDMFIAQSVAIFLSCFVVIGVQDWVFSNIKNVCTKAAKDNFFCNYIIVFGAASEIWGLIGPAKLFSAGKQYNKLLWTFLAGAIFPVFVWLAARRWPRSWIRLVNAPVLFTGTGLLPPATGINFTSWALVGFTFNYMIKRYRNGWWTRYNYVFGAGLDTGTAVSAVVIFFCLVFPDGKNRAFVDGNWWGNTAFENTADYQFTPYKDLNGGAFLPPPGEFRPA
ncbi:small oligopeptide transporter [Violaceomyces palustris]|uniref:Small oligopeptide transporter n=1 Tax=Violaceomyces palustris TaxID=1673888 RepID=A0ACD0NNY3_9BASI|nr:small oligopeptide transporter [Violaceomyces palustris]